MKIDLHTHILPREWPDLDKKYGYAGFVRLDHYKPCCARMMIGKRVFREITDNVWDPKRRIEDCDREKISMQVLSTVPVMFSYWAKPADALDLSRRNGSRAWRRSRCKIPNWPRVSWNDACAS
jgi:aminocarboxymuconate-semialdehyde decarboxylase